MVSEELMNLGQDASALRLLQVLCKCHHAFFVKASAPSLTWFVLKELSFYELPFVICMCIKELANAIELLGGYSKNSGCLLKREGIARPFGCGRHRIA
jgi:hypothetical protein